MDTSGVNYIELLITGGSWLAGHALQKIYPDAVEEIFVNQTELTYPMIQRIITKIKTTRYVPESVKETVYYEQEYKCNLCTILLPPDAQIDHIIPLHQGGDNYRTNLQNSQISML